MQLIRQVEPKNVLLVHGERAKMAFLKQKIVRELNINCYDPPNGVSVTIPTAHSVPLNISTQLMKREYERFAESQQQEAGMRQVPLFISFFLVSIPLCRFCRCPQAAAVAFRPNATQGHLGDEGRRLWTRAASGCVGGG